MNRSPRAEPVVLHITNIPTPYRLPSFRAVGSALGAHGLSFHVFFLGTSKRERSWKLAPEDFAGITYTMAAPEQPSLFRQIIGEIETRRPSVVVLAWAMNGLALRLLLECRRRGIPCILYTGETEPLLSLRRWIGLRELFRQPFLRLANGFIAYGTSARQYLINRRVSPESISIAINTVDTDFFRSRVEALRLGGEALAFRDTFRRPDGEPFSCHILTVAYLVPRKGVDVTIDLIAQLGRPDVLLHVVGSGPEEEMLRERARSRGVEHQVVFHGYRQKDEIPVFYAAADVFVFPSLADIFGLVLVEAAAAGLPIISCSWAGGAADVVEPGGNGYVVEPEDHAGYLEALRTLVASPDLRARMGEHSRRRTIAELMPARHAEGYLAAIRRLVRDGSGARPESHRVVATER